MARTLKSFQNIVMFIGLNFLILQQRPEDFSSLKLQIELIQLIKISSSIQTLCFILNFKDSVNNVFQQPTYSYNSPLSVATSELIDKKITLAFSRPAMIMLNYFGHTNFMIKILQVISILCFLYIFRVFFFFTSIKV